MADSMIENVFFSFVPSFCSSSGSKPALGQLVDIAEDSKLFSLQKPGKLQEIVSHINTCLNSAKQRVEGLVLLDKVLEQCVTEIFTQNTLTWIRFMIQIFQSHDPPSVQRLACYVCGKILDVVSDFTSLSREVTCLVPQIISALLQASTEWRNEACLCINSCILNYPGPCATFKGKIDSFVVKELCCDIVPKEVVRCFALLSRCGGGGNMGLKHTEGWTVQLDRVVSSLHGVLDLLYEGLDTVTPNMKGEGSTRTLPLGDVPTSYPQRYHTLISKCHTYSSCLQALLSESFQSLVKVPSQLILNLICRILSVNCKTLTARPSTQRLLLAGFIPTIHKLAISLLQSLIKCCKRHLLPHTKLVLTLLVQELVWSHTTPTYGKARPYSELRMRVYGCLTLWFQISYTFVETSTEDSALCEEILHDVGMQLDTLKLSSDTGNGSSKSDSQPPPRKKKKTGYQEISQGISSQRKIDRSAGAELVISALEALYWWLTAVGSQMTHKILQSIQEFAVSTSLAMFQQRKNTEIPYGDPCCRYWLLRVLLACCLVPHPSAPSPLHCSLSIFRIGLNDQACMVSTFCLEAQRTLEVLIHPRAPCLKAPVVVAQALVVGGRKDEQTGQTSDTDINVNGLDSQKDPDTSTSHSIWQQTVPQNLNSSCKRSSIFSHKATGDSVSSNIFSRTERSDMSSNVQEGSLSFIKKSKTVVSMPTISCHSDEMEASTSGHQHAIHRDLQEVMVGEEASRSGSDNEMEIGVDSSTSVVQDDTETEITVDTSVTKETGVTECTSVTKETGDDNITAVTEQNQVFCDTRDFEAKDTEIGEVKKDSDKDDSKEKQEEGMEEQEDGELGLMLSSFVNTVTDSGDDEDL